MAFIAIICIPLMLLVKPLYIKFTSDNDMNHVGQKQQVGYSVFKDEDEDDSESPSRNRKPFERAFSEDNGVLNTEK